MIIASFNTNMKKEDYYLESPGSNDNGDKLAWKILISDSG